MSTWADLAADDPELALAGERLLRPTGDGVAFLATVRRDGGPRVHPVAPVLASGRLYVFVVNLSPKYEDLLRDGRFALHASPPTGGGEEFYLTGRAAPIADGGVREAVREACGRRLGGRDFEVLFELDLRRALYTRWDGWGTPKVWPNYRRWRAGRGATGSER